MFDTHVTIVGNVLTAPEWRRTSQSGTLVANFKVASTARRLDRESGRWVDGNSLRVRVNCWRKLAEGVASSVMVGDPVVVVGRMYTRDWTDDAGNHRTMYELEAVAVGHDLARGRGRFARNRPTMSTSSVEDGETEARVHGEATESVPVEEAPVSLDERVFEDEDEYRGLAMPVARGYEPTPGYASTYLPADDFDGRVDLDGRIDLDTLPSGDVSGPGRDTGLSPDGQPRVEGGPGVEGLGGEGIDGEPVADGSHPLLRDDPDDGREALPDATGSGVGRGRRGRGRTPASV
ncbi:single-stranded DNA-binding protein [Plantactinospora soyae]|uniref:Single-stranded DNA-binding protein n=1 Tax=Plantactinospora soyae TaxID=1544732 RepID=A0A927LY61_9ACTN|nr:single-stranded DNA-binding protein [Plantactinospora soyae]MBE1484554.1 single-strand DNA-binding protein [Plantactinospora soyae]